MTPLGIPVDPLVYMMMAVSVPEGGTDAVGGDIKNIRGGQSSLTKKT